MNRIHRAHTIAAVAAGLGLLAPAAIAAPAGSGLRVRVIYGPTCPVERPGERCERPYDATLRIRRTATGRIVATVRSGKDGRFRIRLAPGRYVVEPRASMKYPRAAPVKATVHRHRFTLVTVSFDSGIR